MLQSFHYFSNLNFKFCTVAKNFKPSIMSAIKTVLIDLSGTLHIEDHVIPGSIEALERLRETDVTIKFCTNTTKGSRKFLYNQCTKLGLQLDEEEIYTSLWAVRDFIIQEGLKPFFILEDDALTDFTDLHSFEGKPDSVVLGVSEKNLNRATLNKALRILLDGGILVAPHQGKYFQRKDGLALGPGPFIKTLEYATGSKAVLIGKPAGEFYKGVLGKVPPTQAVMIGDDVRGDIFGAQQLGIRGYLVRTGKFRPGDEAQIDPPPYKVVDSFCDAVEDIISELKLS